MSILDDLDARSREIFRRLVQTYLETGEPVGSRTLSQDEMIRVSSATVRNVMADLTDMGLLEAPHVSAGRLPTQAGLRLFVDGMMEIGDLPAAEREAIEAQLAGEGRKYDDVLADAAQRLSGLTSTASLVLARKTEAPLKHIEFVATGPGQALVVLVFDDGRVENRVLEAPAGVTPSDMAEAGNYLNARLRGRTLGEAREAVLEEVGARRAELDELSAKLVRAGVAEFSGGDGASLIVRGQSRLLDDGAADDLERVRKLFDDLERKQEVIELLEAAKDGEGVRIFIGSENRLFSLSGSSVIVAPYRDSRRQIVGVVGVIGPTRLNYARIIPMVDYTAEVVSRLLK